MIMLNYRSNNKMTANTEGAETIKRYLVLKDIFLSARAATKHAFVPSALSLLQTDGEVPREFSVKRLRCSGSSSPVGNFECRKRRKKFRSCFFSYEIAFGSVF